MMKNELLLLGLLKNSPKHGYEIKQFIRKTISPFINIDTTSIYYPLKELERKGFVIKSSSRAGKRPGKFIYELTQKGLGYFDRLLEESLVTIERPYFNIDLALYFLSYIKPAQAKRRLKMRLNLLRRLEGRLLNLSRSLKATDPNLVNILNHNLKLLKAEISSLSDLESSMG